MASSQRFRRGVASVAVRPGVGVASQRLCPGVRPGVAPPRPGVAPNSSARPGVASQRLTDGVASVVSQSDVRAFLLQSKVKTSGRCLAIYGRCSYVSTANQCTVFQTRHSAPKHAT